MSIIAPNHLNSESKINGGASELDGPSNNKFKTNAEIFKKRNGREANPSQSSPFMTKSKLNASGEVAISKDTGKALTNHVGNQIIQANPNKKTDHLQIDLNQRYAGGLQASHLQLKQEATFGAASSSTPYDQRHGVGGNVRSANQSGFATMPSKGSSGGAGRSLYRGATQAEAYKGSGAGGNSSGGAEPGGATGDGDFAGGRSSLPGYQHQGATSPALDASNGFKNLQNLKPGHQRNGTQQELIIRPDQTQSTSFANQGKAGRQDNADASIESIGIEDNKAAPNSKQTGIQKQGKKHQNVIQNMNLNQNQMNELVQNTMSKINKTKGKLDKQQRKADKDNKQKQQDEGDTYQLTNNSDPNQNANSQDNNSRRHQRGSSDAQSLRSIRSSANISVINYNNATINMNFNEGNVEVSNDQNQIIAQQQLRDAAQPQQEGFAQNFQGNEVQIIENNFGEQRQNQSYPQKYPQASAERGEDFQHQLNFSKFLPNFYGDQNNAQTNGSQMSNAYNDAIDPAQKAAVGQHRNSNSATQGAEQRAGLLGSTHQGGGKGPHQSSASMGNNQNQYHHGQAASQVFSGGNNSGGPAQIQKVGTVNYDLSHHKSPSQFNQQNLNRSFGKSSNSLPNNIYIPINAHGQVNGSGHSPQPQRESHKNTQSFGGSTGQFKSPGGTSLHVEDQLNINQLKSGLLQLNQQVQLQQQQLQIQNQQLIEGSNLSQSQMLEMLKQYQNADIGHVDKQNRRANRFEGQKDAARRAGEDPYGMKQHSPSPNGHNGQRQRSSSRKIIKKIVKKKSMQDVGDIGDPRSVYEVTTIKIGRDGSKTFERVEKMNQQPNACKDLRNSMKMLDQIKRSSSTVNLEHINDKNQLISQTRSRMVAFNILESKQTEQTNMTNLSKATGAGFLSSIMNPKNVASVQTIQVSNNSSNVYVQTVDSEKQPKKQKKKIIIIQKKRRADGSVECARKEIYKDYGDHYAKRESRRLNSALDYYQGSAKVLEKIQRENNGVQINPDRSIIINGAKNEDIFNQRQNISESLGTKSVQNKSPNLRSQKNAQIIKNAAKRPATALDRQDGNRKSVSSVLKKQEQQKGTKISKGPDKGVRSEYQDQQKNKPQLNKGRQQNSTGKLADNASTSNDTKLPHDTFDLQPKANPSNMMSTLIESNKGTTHQKYNKRKEKQQFQQNAVSLAYKADKGELENQEGDEAQEDTDEQNDVQQVKNIFARDVEDEESIAPNFANEDNKSKKKAKDRALDMTRDSKSTRKNKLTKKQKSGGASNQEANEEDEKVSSKQQSQSQTAGRNANKAAQGSMSPTSLSTNLYTFKLPPFDASVYIQFIDQLIFGQKRKDAIMQPIPPAVGQLKFSITRNKSGMNKITPSYYLNLEKNNGGKILILYGKKMPFKKQSYYLISLEKNKKRTGDKEAETCLGKLRAVDGDQDKFVLYDAGENYNQKGVQFKDLRKEHGTFIYRYEPCNVGNIRKMTILYPAITCLRLQPKAGSDDAMTNDPQITNNMYNNKGRNQNPKPHQSGSSADYDPNDRQDYMMSTQNQEYSVAATSQHQKALGVKGVRDNQGREIPDGSKYFYSYVDWRPTSEQDTLVYNYENGERGKNVKYKTFVDNPPQWNPKTNTYVYDFKGRVTEPSIKNFQLIPEIDGRRGDTLQDFVLQFGKRDKDEFILDIQFPISIFQGFGLALSAFDTD